jgi:hypothetical protein
MKNFTSRNGLCPKFKRIALALLMLCIAHGGFAASLMRAIPMSFEAPAVQVTLTSPANSAVFDAGTLPTFAWTVPPIAGGGPFKLTIVEISAGQSAGVAIHTNKPIFEKDSLNQLSAQYPQTAPSFLVGQTYAWAVSFNGVMSEVRTFSTKPPVISAFSPVRGPVGTVINITGTGFDGPSDVIIGGSKTAMLLTNTATKITAKILPANASGSVKVRVPGGAIARASGMFTITDTTKLTLPENMASFDAGLQPTFKWTIPASAGGGTFKLRIVQISDGQNPVAAIHTNKPIFEKDSLNAPLFQIPPTGPVLYAGQTYAWAVSYNGFFGEVRSFSIKPPVITSFSPANGPVGTIVKLTGTGLGGAVEVIIGSKNALVLKNSNTEVTAMIMPANVSGSVKVRAPGGAIARASGNFTITPTLYPNLQQGPKMADTAKYFDPVNYFDPPQTTNRVRKSNVFQQGYSVALSADGNTAMAGMKVGEVISIYGYGGVIFYERQNGIWKQSGRPRFAYGSVLGYKSAINADGTVALATAVDANIGHDINGTHAVTVAFFKVNGQWTDGVQLGAWGHSVALSADGNTGVVAESYLEKEGYYAGTYRAWATVMHREANNFFKLTSQLKSTADGYAPGHAIAISADGNTIAAVIAKVSPKPFSTLVYKKIDTAWVIQQELPINGNEIALNADGSVLLTSDNATGASIYTRTGTLWSMKQKLTETGKGSMTADGNTLMFSGSAGPIAYTRGGTGTWVKQSTSFGPHAGVSVAVSADGTTGFMGDTRDTTLAPTQTFYPGTPWIVGGPLGLGAVYAYVAGTPIITPTTAATAITFTNTTTNSTTLSWTKGSGTKRAVFMMGGHNRVSYTI